MIHHKLATVNALPSETCHEILVSAPSREGMLAEALQSAVVDRVVAGVVWSPASRPERASPRPGEDTEGMRTARTSATGVQGDCTAAARGLPWRLLLAKVPGASRTRWSHAQRKGTTRILPDARATGAAPG